MKFFIVCCFLATSIFAKEYYAKIEPIQNYTVKAAVSGKVLFTNEQIEGNSANNSVIVKIDSKINEIDLKYSKQKLEYINKMIKIEQKNYERLNQVSSKSEFEKDAQKLKVVNLQSNKADLITKIQTLEDTISNKKLVEKSTYISNIAVSPGDYVNPGNLLYEAKDLSKGKLEIFIPINKIEDIKNKDIYIDNKKSAIKIDKIYQTADSSHISSYKIRLVLNDVKKFSKLVKIEFK